MDEASPAITRSLAQASDPAVRERVLALVYDDLLRIARAELARHRRGNTLNTRALVNEAYLKLFDRSGLDYESRGHFYATAARAMRQVVIDYARSRHAERRGGGAEHLDLDALDGQPLAIDSQIEQLLAIDTALEKLADMDPRLVKVVELRFFAGMEVKDIADLLGLSEPTIKRDTRAAKAFLHRELSAGQEPPVSPINRTPNG